MRPDLPSGTVTFLFTDVEGSTRLLHELGADGYAAALAEHRSIVRDACAAHGGVEVDTQGDAFFVAFPTAPGALDAAQTITERLEPTRIRVRVGVHTGTPLLTDEGYVGEDVHRAARIAASGHGGQVLVSQSTASLVDDVELRDVGAHRLKDLTGPQRLYQLGRASHAAIRSLHLTNLPIPATPFVGRERELAEVASAIARPEVRLLTLTGPGGTGKTRLAAQAAGLAADDFPDGVWWVPLASLRDPALVLPSAAHALGAREELALHLGERRLLLLLDNFEHVVEAAESLSGLLASCANLTLLVTSREPLHLAAEHEYPVRPFAHDDAVDFFLVRARAANPDLEPDGAMNEICLRLDELPLALELAAARVKALSPAQILQRLDRRLPLLTGGARDAPERQRTLRATIDWSYALLTANEQTLFAELSVFAGGCTLEAAEAIADADLDTLQSLVDKSLVRFSDERYWMLETIREYAASLEEWRDARERLRTDHLAFFLALALEAEPNLTEHDQQRWYELLAAEQDNLREALAHACESGDRERALMLAGTIWRFWWTRGQIDEAERWYERVHAMEGASSDLARARALFGAAHVAEARSHVDLTRDLYEEATKLLRRLGETRWLVMGLTHLAGTYEEVDPARVEEIQLEAIALAEESGDRRGAAIAKGNLASHLMVVGDIRRAELLSREALAAHRERGDVYGIAASLKNLATIAFLTGDVDVATRHLVESANLSRSIGDKLGLSAVLYQAAAIVLSEGEAYDATRLLAANDRLMHETGFASGEPDFPALGDVVGKARELLGRRFEEAWTAGSRLDLDSALHLALERLTPHSSPRVAG